MISWRVVWKNLLAMHIGTSTNSYIIIFGTHIHYKLRESYNWNKYDIPIHLSALRRQEKSLIIASFRCNCCYSWLCLLLLLEYTYCVLYLTEIFLSWFFVLSYIMIPLKGTKMLEFHIFVFCIQMVNIMQKRYRKKVISEKNRDSLLV